MAQFNPMTAFGADISKAASALVRTCSPRARIIHQRLREISECGPSVSTIGQAWADVRRVDPACSPWALAA